MLKNRFILLFSIIFVAIVVTLFAKTLSNSYNDEVVQAGQQRYLSFLLADEFRQTSMDLTRLARTYVSTQERQYLDQYWDIVNWRNGDLARPTIFNSALYPGVKKPQKAIMRELGFTPREFGLLEEASNNSDALIATETQAMSIVEQGRWVDGPYTKMAQEPLDDFALRILFDGNYHREVERIMSPVNQFFAALDQRTSDAVAAASVKAERWSSIVMGMQVVVALLTLVGGVVAIKSVFTPLGTVVDAMRNIGNGDGSLNSRLPVSGKNELSHLASGFNRFSDNILQLVNQVRHTTSDVQVSSSQMLSLTEQAKHIIGEQQFVLSQSADAMSRIVEISNEVASNAQQTAQATADAEAQSKQGMAVVQGTISHIDQLSSDIQQAQQAISAVEQDSNTITSVLDVIRGIAEQTNLLALNAAIEAARAGEQGRGFAVVADEVRSLASKTQESTTEIQTMIERLQAGSLSAVETMRASTEQAQQCVQQARETGDVLVSISASVGQINKMNTGIADLGMQQMQTINDIDQQLQVMLSHADKTVGDIGEVLQGARHVGQQSNELGSLVAQFNTD